MVPQETPLLGTRPTYREVDVNESTAHPAHLSTQDHDDAVEAHYASLERPHACSEGVVYIGHLVIGEDGEEVEVVEAVQCRRCAGDVR
jgi:hypothetical protein